MGFGAYARSAGIDHGLFGTVLQPLAGNLIVSMGWRQAYFALGGLVLAGSVPVVLLTIRFAPQKKGMLPFGAEQAEKRIGPRESTGISAPKARKTVAFLALVLFMFFRYCCSLFRPAFAQICRSAWI